MGKSSSALSAESSLRPTLTGHYSGRIVEVRGRRAMIEVDGVVGPTLARVQTRITREELRAACEAGHEAIVVFLGGDASSPVVQGFVAPLAAPDDDHEGVGEGAAPSVVHADVDGERVRLVGRQEIVLECGDASITMRANGRIVLRGTYIETYATGTNRVKGGQVLIN